jgi:hypothetical protein
LEGVLVDMGDALVSGAAGVVIASVGAAMALVEALVSAGADMVLVSAGGADVVSSALLLQPTNAKGRARVKAARREYFCRRLFMKSFIRRDAGG